MDGCYPVLKAATPEAKVALQRDSIVLREFPFRVGREARFAVVHGKLRSAEKRTRSSVPNNDIYLLDRGELLNISREHCQIEQIEDGSYEIVDRGSTCGTVVDGTSIGGETGTERCPVANGSRIVLGMSDSPFIFEFVVPT
jgi:pSer/pThr/pTyr-binding forkhead associated (FHA) protein